ncbi:MAG: PEP/pyruvate-binding domain-containing protein, partial [Planctomycetota bacterium]
WNEPGFPIYFGSQGEDFPFEAYTRGVGYGRVRILSPVDLVFANLRGDIGPQDILVLEEAPRDIEGVAGGVVTLEPQGELSHLAIRTARRGTPNCYARDARILFESFEGQLVRLEVTESRPKVEPATESEAREFWAATRRELSTPPELDSNFAALSSLEAIRKQELSDQAVVSRFGGKATNFARLQSVLSGEFANYRERGFAIPIRYYLQFLRANQISSALDAERLVSYEDYLLELIADPTFATNSRFRYRSLQTLRTEMRERGNVDPELVTRIAERIAEVFGTPTTTRVRFRSSSNVEDAIEFNGAGLYDSTSGCAADDLDDDDLGPSLCDRDEDVEEGIGRALREVWASLWNFRAYEERAFYTIRQSDAGMAVLVTRAFLEEQVNGVALTGNPSDRSDRRFVVTAQAGEESVVNPEPGVIAEKTLVRVDDSGEAEDILRVVRSNQIPQGRLVLSDQQIRELARVLRHVTENFPWPDSPFPLEDTLLDVEFKIEANGDLAFKQARPFLITGPETATPTFELEIPPGTMACGGFRIGRGPRREYELQATLEFSSDLYFLPTSADRFQAELVRTVSFGPNRLSGAPLGPGEVRLQKAVRAEGFVDYSFGYDQRFELETGDQLDLRIRGLEYRARDGIPVSTRHTWTDESLIEGPVIEAQLVDGDPTLLTLGSCTHAALRQFRVELSLDDGTELDLQERFAAELASERDSSPAQLVRAEVRFRDQAPRIVQGYWNLVYAADRHNEDVEYWIVLDPPVRVPSASRPVFVVHVETPAAEGNGKGRVAYLDEALQLISRARVQNGIRVEMAENDFLRGDVDEDSRLSLSDATRLLGFLFQRGPPLVCRSSADANDDGKLRIDDAVLLLGHLFRGEQDLPEPFPDCGADPTPDLLGCHGETSCAG